MIFEATPEQIRQLDSTVLVKLMKRLMLAECRLADIPLRAVAVPLQITVADGGEDGRIEWSGGVDETDYFPTRFCVFQSKAQNLTESTIKAEILKKQESGPPKLNEAVLEVLPRHGAYIVFCSHAFGGQKIKKLRKAIMDAIREGGGNPDEAEAIEVYDANRIADWVNTHTAVALWLTAQTRGRALAGFLSHDTWGRSPDISAVPWIDDDVARFVPVNLVIPDAERKEQSRNAWTFGQAATYALKYLAEDKVALRVAGPSGFGKSRFVYELFNWHKITAEETENAAVIYADLSIAGDTVLQLALELSDSGTPAILVVDECPDETHTKLVALARRAGSRLRLVTIDIETKVVQARDTLAIRLEPAPDLTIGNIAKAVAPGLNDSEMRFIQELSHGFLQMAVLAAQENAHGRQTISSAEQLLDRIIWGRNTHNETAQKALEFLSLFSWVGLTERAGHEISFIAREFAGIPEDVFIESVKSFKPRGIIEQRGDFMQVTPIPLATCLGVRRLSLLPDGKLAAFFAKAPPRLKTSLLKRLRWLDTAPEAKHFAQTLLSPENLGNITALNTDFGAECLDRLVHVDPDTAMATIDRVFGSLTTRDLGAIKDGRRHLVWALEKLAFRKQSFDRAATLLRRLAAAETEGRISNNATGQFKQLYQLYLSGTEVDPAARLLVLDDGLCSSDPKERELCLEALVHMLSVNHFTRGGGAEEIGSGDRLKDWQPMTDGDICNFIRAAVARLTGIALSDDPLSSRATKLLGAYIRTLINQLPLDEVKAMIDRIVARCGFWLDALQGVNAWLFFDRKGSPEALGKDVRSYFDELMPTDPVELVVLYTQGWQADFHDPDVNYGDESKEGRDYEYSIRKSKELAKIIAEDPALIERAVSRLATSNAKTVFPFAKRLAELVPDPVELFKTALAYADASSQTANLGFFGGLIAGADSHDPATARTCIRESLKSQKLKPDAISMIGSGRLAPKDIDLVVSLLETGDVSARQCASLSCGRSMDHLSPEEIMPLLDELMAHGAEGLWTVLDIITMVLYGGKRSPEPFLATIRSILVDPALFDNVMRGTMGGYHLQEMIGLLIKHNAINKEFARALAKQLFSICTQHSNDIFFIMDGPVRTALQSLMEGHSKEIWGEASKLLLQNDAGVKFRFEQLVGCPSENYLGGGLFYKLPAELYLDWARKAPSLRAFIIMKWMPLTIKTTGDKLIWHPALEAFIAEFGAADHVLDELSARLCPRSWSGSLVPYLEPLLPLLETWTNHPLPTVRQWASRQIISLKNWIEQERRRDEEDVIRYG